MNDTPSTRPEGVAPHIPYICPQSGRVRFDVLPSTLDEIRQTGERLRAIYAQVRENS